MRKKIFLSAAILAAVVSAYAQGNGQAGITEATNLITGYFDPGTKLVYAIGAVCGLIGGVKVYNKFSSGDPDTSKSRKTKRDGCEKRNAFIETKTKCASNLIRKATVHLQNQSKTPSF